MHGGMARHRDQERHLDRHRPHTTALVALCAGPARRTPTAGSTGRCSSRSSAATRPPASPPAARRPMAAQRVPGCRSAAAAPTSPETSARAPSRSTTTPRRRSDRRSRRCRGTSASRSSGPRPGRAGRGRAHRARAAKPAVVFRGPRDHFTDRRLHNGRRYRYVVTLIDQAGNRSADARARSPPARALLLPASGAHVRSAPLLVWKRMRRASYYNAQLVRTRHEVLTRLAAHAAPAAPRVALRRPAHRCAGHYCWYVWPGFGTRSERRYGRLLGKSCFTGALTRLAPRARDPLARARTRPAPIDASQVAPCSAVDPVEAAVRCAQAVVAGAAATAGCARRPPLRRSSPSPAGEPVAPVHRRAGRRRCCRRGGRCPRRRGAVVAEQAVVTLHARHAVGSDAAEEAVVARAAP